MGKNQDPVSGINIPDSQHCQPVVEPGTARKMVPVPMPSITWLVPAFSVGTSIFSKNLANRFKGNIGKFKIMRKLFNSGMWIQIRLGPLIFVS
jgi:hypothetical protein